jgi:hypothetical protein
MLSRASKIAHQLNQPPQATYEERHEQQARIIAGVILSRQKVFGIELSDDVVAAIKEDEADHMGEA